MDRYHTVSEMCPFNGHCPTMMGEILTLVLIDCEWKVWNTCWSDGVLFWATGQRARSLALRWWNFSDLKWQSKFHIQFLPINTKKRVRSITGFSFDFDSRKSEQETQSVCSNNPIHRMELCPCPVVEHTYHLDDWHERIQIVLPRWTSKHFSNSTTTLRAIIQRDFVKIENIDRERARWRLVCGPIIVRVERPFRISVLLFRLRLTLVMQKETLFTDRPKSFLSVMTKTV